MAPEFGKVVPEFGAIRPKPLTPCHGGALARLELLIWRTPVKSGYLTEFRALCSIGHRHAWIN
ncbi:MAG: hypothetical protein E5W70_16625 [Mesorhizobium sp.]|uniref:hypothetical protein n=1 Tax=Mesorhizobium sp. TaxID=1871066 RepID=UPI0012018D8D|nr:hypothetical protein [Mesorhizobium sp.]TIT21540.1 MAG: hypothetical protein E5W70_16625 [Mesorhizobium sp.]